MPRTSVITVLFALLALAVAPARAASVDDALAHFAADKFPETDRGIDDLVASGATTAPAVLSALADGRLSFDPGTQKVYYVDASGALDDAATGDKAAGDVTQSGLKKVRLNNAIRSKINAAVGSLDLLSPDRGKRIAAESAKLTSLQTKQSLAIQSLSIANAQPQALLTLFR